MRINEYIPANGKFFDRGLKEDQHYPLALRRPRLTLRHLNKLRKIRDIQRLEQRKREANIPEIYRKPDKDPKSDRK
jgi:hypothetical protein